MSNELSAEQRIEMAFRTQNVKELWEAVDDYAAQARADARWRPCNQQPPLPAQEGQP